jgi:hypothetical protein
MIHPENKSVFSQVNHHFPPKNGTVILKHYKAQYRPMSGFDWSFDRKLKPDAP